ncbi:MAG: manganese efflux pump [Clostridia bacterium]|nr:manganese efflux pump [Clostridia bacterium]
MIVNTKGFLLMIIFILLTALTVSIDSFICGFSLSFLRVKKPYIVLCITFTVLVMCLITNYLAMLFSGLLNEKTAGFGGLILIGVGIYNLVKKDKDNHLNSRNLRQVFLTGFAVGLDGAIANLSLSLMNLNALYVPVLIAVMHGLMISIGVWLPNAPIIKNFSKYTFIAPIILIVLGAYKFLGVFI